MDAKPHIAISDIDQYMKIKPADENGIAFHAPFEPGFRLAGNAFQSEMGVKFRRIPFAPFVSDGVEALAENTAGMQLQFRSDSPVVTVKAKLQHGELFHHMPQTGSSSFDLYVGGPGNWRCVRAACFLPHQTDFCIELGNFPGMGVREYLINFPLYNGVKELWIGLKAGAQILPPSPWGRKPLAVYGTSITQGGCASRPGMAWPNVLSRWQNREIFNFGFSGNGRGEVAAAEILGRVRNVAGFILDYEANAQLTGITKTLETFIRTLRKAQPETPIMVVSMQPQARLVSRGRAEDAENVPDQAFAKARTVYHEILDKLRQEGMTKLYFVNGIELLGEDWDECMMDGCHLNDLGFYRMAENLNKRIIF